MNETNDNFLKSSANEMTLEERKLEVIETGENNKMRTNEDQTLRADHTPLSHSAMTADEKPKFMDGSIAEDTCNSAVMDRKAITNGHKIPSLKLEASSKHNSQK